MPAPGFFTLRDNVLPKLTAGSYTLTGAQTLSAPGASPEPLEAHLEVTGPRFALPPGQILSTFPPNQAQGAFSSRLAQIVLRRRTLPWERRLETAAAGVAAVPASVPWLALVLLADGEAELRTSRPVAECVSAGVTLAGRNDVTVGDCIAVTRRVVEQVFPLQSELPHLAHVREVDLSDTELAMGDDDGFLAVLFANRLPQPGVRYRACLVSLEGQYDALPVTAAVAADAATGMKNKFVYPEIVARLGELSYRYGGALGGVRPGGDPVMTMGTEGRTAQARRARTSHDAWSEGAPRAQAAIAEQAPPVVTSALVGAMHRIPIEIIDPLAQVLVFPLLASWQFTCSGPGDFQSLMQGLDVGMLGTLPAEPAPGPGGKPPPKRTRPLPVVLDTGHVELEHTSREGEGGTVWYRGPLVPRPGGREQKDAEGLLPLLHTSDQARRVGPDGRENLALAAAFEIGRLLALSEPAVVAALLLWRKDALAAAARQALLADEPTLSGAVGLGAATVGARAGAALVAALGKAGAARLGVPRPSIDPGRPVPGIDGGDPLPLLSAGLGISQAVLRDLIQPGVSRQGGVVVPAAARAETLEQLAAHPERELATLRDAALAAADQLGRAVLGLDAAPGPVVGPRAASVRPERSPAARRRGVVEGRSAPDALDDLLARLGQGPEELP